jgi:hypothetical protein
METLSIKHTFVTSGATLQIQKDELGKVFITLTLPGSEVPVPLETSLGEIGKLVQILNLGASAIRIMGIN